MTDLIASLEREKDQRDYDNGWTDAIKAVVDRCQYAIDLIEAQKLYPNEVLCLQVGTIKALMFGFQHLRARRATDE